MLVSIIIISLVGTFLHFLYEISNHNKIVALFAAVNESTWEHIKIALSPMIFWSLYDGYIFGMNSNYFIAKSLSLLTVIIVIPLIFYTYTRFTKKPFLPIDILTFYIAITWGQIVFYRFINLEQFPFVYQYLGAILLFMIFGSYMTLTLQPLKTFIFKDPISKKYGTKGHTEFEHKNKEVLR